MKMGKEIGLKTVKDLLGMNFFIPDYQRGYRWEKQQAEDLLEDIYAFSERHKTVNGEEIYCIQPLVVSEREEDIFRKCKEATNLEDIKKFIKGSWNVVDGQQRLTTIFLLLSCLDNMDKYSIEYETREDSEKFLMKIGEKNQEEADENSDYYHMYKVYSTIQDWLERHKESKESLKETLLNRVNFIWYAISPSDEIETFTRLNIGKISLTNSELIKALFLNKSNCDTKDFKALQRKIAVEWDEIENTLQNDEFWAFIYGDEYNKPTRIDFILDSICEKDDCGVYEKGTPKQIEFRKSRIGDGEYKTFRYFELVFSEKKENCDGVVWLNELWKNVKSYYQIFKEWYQDYKLYHYIGYLSYSSFSSFSSESAAEYVSKWKNKTKTEFVNYLKKEITEQLCKKEWIKELRTYQFDQEGTKSKRDCVDILLLHNIETIIQQNEKLVSETRYNLPNFSKFPFHLYKKENWQVEHIRPNAGDRLKTDDERKLYLSLAKDYFKDTELEDNIDKYLSKEESAPDFNELLEKIHEYGEPLSDGDKNAIWNFVLLDAKTNEQYKNQIFPVKRDFIRNKENGEKVKYVYSNGELVKKTEPGVAFVPLCTKNVFSKLYTTMPKTMINWNKEDAEDYLADIEKKLNDYLGNKDEEGGNDE